MFETTTGFLWFFFILLALILAGIRHEDKLIRLEDGAIEGVRQTVREWRTRHDD